jgi:hypothetical protein
LQVAGTCRARASFGKSGKGLVMTELAELSIDEKKIVTLNEADFQRVAPHLAERIVSP